MNYRSIVLVSPLISQLRFGLVPIRRGLNVAGGRSEWVGYYLGTDTAPIPRGLGQPMRPPRVTRYRPAIDRPGPAPVTGSHAQPYTQSFGRSHDSFRHHYYDRANALGHPL